MTEEQKNKMRAGREAAAAKRKAEAERKKSEAEKALAVAADEAEYLPPPVAEPEPLAIEEPDGGEPLLSAAEIERIKDEARKKVDAELLALNADKKKLAIAEALDAETLALRRELGLTNAGDDVIEFLVNVAPFSPGLVIDGKTYQHGQWVKTTRRQYDSFRDIMSRSWESEDRAGNPNKRFEAERRLAGVQNPMLMEQRMADGTFTIGLPGSVNARTGATSGLRSVA